MNNGIYIHIPFCVKKCAYCDFNSYADKNHLMSSYVDRLICEIQAKKGFCADTVYVGGGTPTTLSCDELTRIFHAVFENFKISPDAEITIEANPKTADKEKFLLLKSLGVNRVSIGVQSFCDDELLGLSRIHSSADAKNAVLDAKSAGFSNISIDLMYGIKNQTTQSFEQSLKTAVSLPLTHISAYSLILEEGTPLYEENPVLCDEETERKMHNLCVSYLKEHGYKHYEISNFAKDGYESRHNTKYWTGISYEGIGAGAHSYVNNIRKQNEPDIQKYIDSTDPVVYTEYITEKEALKERFMLGFRMIDGFDHKGEFSDKLQKLSDNGLVILRPDNVRLSERGIDLANLVFMEFVGED